MSIHPSAVVEEGVILGKNVTVGPLTYIEMGAVVGDGCSIGPQATIYRYTTLGPGCQVHAGAVLGGLPQDLAHQNEESYVKLGSKCVIREGVTVHRGTKAGTSTIIGDECYLMNFSHVAHNATLGKRVILVNGALLGGYSEVGDAAFISALCLVHQFCRVGRLAMLGGSSGISKDVPPFCTTHPFQPNKILGINTVGMRRAGISPAARQQVKQAFTLMYRSGLNVSQALKHIREAFQDGPAIEFCEFVETSKRGICGMSNAANDNDAPADL
ncbi:MAG: acyl-ACP--UDP-N-acetylglucosamine O-acyltransferase [Gammaproteobacteria bacterium]|nr:acyl-ACP--UDP-N-acetylglucosamine O-acyltransferase [Gammaproteobacteria bacterium]MCI0591509.1 acyl-ACP--UDP-N-acetylglucosamine O-acyltransferase [Gammaproteobacteria bacterium]